MPLFPLAMIGGVILQLAMESFGYKLLILTLALTLFWIAFGLIAFGKESRANREAERRARQRTGAPA